MAEKLDKKIFQLLHKYGKLIMENTSTKENCDEENPHTTDKMFVAELKEVFEKYAHN